jgi:hypothetical protein
MDSATLAKQIQDYDAKKVTSTDALNEAMGQFGVPEIRKNVANLRTTVANTQNSLNAVDPSVTGRTSQSLVTEAQRQRMVANERAPIAEQLGGQNQALGQSTQDLNDALGQATTLATNKVNDYNAGRQALQSQYDTTYKREQDSVAAQVAREQAAREQANQDRQFALASRSGGKSANPADIKLQAGQHVASGLASNVGKDGKVSNETWSAALNDAVASGFTVREFWQKFGQYVNPKYKSNYAGYVNR